MLLGSKLQPILMLLGSKQPIFLKVVESNRKGLFMATIPYKIGIFALLSVVLLQFL